MTPADYRRERELRGSQAEVAKLLDVHRQTIAKRERGAPGAPITREAWLALLSLRKPRIPRGTDPPR